MIMTFEAVYCVAELLAFIMDFLALPTIISLSFTTKLNYVRVQGHLRSKMAKCLAPFGLLLDDTLQHLIFTDGLIIGFIALEAVAPFVWSIATDSLDIVVEGLHFNLITNWFKSHGYELNEATPTIPNPLLFGTCHSFLRQFPNREMVINLFTVKTKYQEIEFVFHSSNTAGMNMITGEGLFVPYRSLLDLELAVRNDSTRMGSTDRSTIIPTNELQKLTQIDKNNNLKASSNGFTLITPNLHFPTNICYCTPLSTCSLKPRISTDKECSIIRLLQGDEYKAIQSNQKILISIPKVPLVNWKLTDGEGGSGGYVFDTRRLTEKF